VKEVSRRELVFHADVTLELTTRIYVCDKPDMYESLKEEYKGE
jgi:hypothetical protein